MAGEIYQTEGIILGHYKHGEDDKIISVITDSFGYIYAKSTGTRKISSKLRGNLSDYTHAHLDLVMGKHGWKIIGASQIDSLDTSNKDGLKVFARIISLIKKIAGEDEDGKIFEEVKNLFYKINAGEDIDKHQELLMVIRILYALGYWEEEQIPASHDKIQLNYKKYLDAVNSSIDRAIN